MHTYRVSNAGFQNMTENARGTCYFCGWSGDSLFSGGLAGTRETVWLLVRFEIADVGFRVWGRSDFWEVGFSFPLAFHLIGLREACLCCDVLTCWRRPVVLMVPPVCTALYLTLRGWAWRNSELHRLSDVTGRLEGTLGRMSGRSFFLNGREGKDMECQSTRHAFRSQSS